MGGGESKREEVWEEKGGNVMQERKEECGGRLRTVDEDGVSRRGRGGTTTGVWAKEWEEDGRNVGRNGRKIRKFDKDTVRRGRERRRYDNWDAGRGI